MGPLKASLKTLSLIIQCVYRPEPRGLSIPLTFPATIFLEDSSTAINQFLPNDFNISPLVT